MRLVIQRVSESSVAVDGEVVGKIGLGLCVLVGVAPGDTARDAALLADKTRRLRIFRDEQGKMNRSVEDVGGAILAISQFTLFADCSRGNRPFFGGAAAPDHAEAIYEAFIAQLRQAGLRVETGRFGAMMDVQIRNDGPVTLILEGAG